MKLAKIVFTILLLFSSFIPSHVAQADISPPPAPELGGLEPFEYQTTNVQMVYEQVEMEIQPVLAGQGDDSLFVNRVNVTAYFTMHNHGVSSESMQVIFPLESFSHCRIAYGGGTSFTTYFIQEDSFTATIDGHHVTTQKVMTNHPFKIEGVCEQMTWAGFDVTFPAKEDVVIKVKYSMETMDDVDSMQNIEYILETGAGWAGPIKRGCVIVKFPYAVTKENVLSESTPGYQFRYNEISWSFENLEPTSRDNIHISIVSPDMWQKILLVRRDLREHSELPEKWLELAQIYSGISMWHAGELRSVDYRQEAYAIYETGITAHPDHAELYAKYAAFKLYDSSLHLNAQITEKEALQILALLNKAFALDPNNETARVTLSNLMGVAPFITFTPPATIPPTATPLFIGTPSFTPFATISPLPSETPAVTAVHTKFVREPASTSTPKPTTANTVKPTVTGDQDDMESASPFPIAIVGMIATLLAGFVIGSVWSRRKSTDRTT